MTGELGREDDLDDDSFQTREVFARFGVAAYQGQVLETGLVTVLSTAQASSAPHATGQTFDEYFEGNLQATMGRLVTLLTPFLLEDGGLLDDLRRALAERNRLVHRFFYDHADDFASFTGREAMLAELWSAEALFEEVNDRLTPVLDRLLASRGIDADARERLVQQAYDERLRRATAADDE
jgi:hypothetical protein